MSGLRVPTIIYFLRRPIATGFLLGSSNNNVKSFCSPGTNKRIQEAGDSITNLTEVFGDAVIPTVSIGTVTNLILTIIILRQILSSGTKNRYLFLLCRACVDTITCLSMLTVVAYRRQRPDKGQNVTVADGTVVFVPFGTPVLSAFIQFNFWMLCNTYALLSFITFIAVRFPFFYRTRVTTRFCCTLLTTSIVLGICYSILCYRLGTTPFLTIEFDKPQLLITYTPLGNPDRVMAVAVGNAIFILVLWISVFAQYIGVLFILVKLRAGRSDNRYLTHLNSSLRLSMSILVWSLMCALMIAAVVSPPLWNQRNTKWLQNYENLPKNGTLSGSELLCMEMASIATSLYDLLKVSVFAESLWLARFVWDPFICVCCDRYLRAFCAGNIKRLGTFRISTEKKPP
ncbi:unnamed protein product [Enterobius vermicularis]|uniref:G_PROTEIN_RECEP_F1_2 domain-containing protein n=1 Tax=Enterobius vermicularis TaxID=51028 RepID=A0A0N4V2P4_ENTVE|nr:unnamed protein product [Enterobius vermicularis]